MRVLIDSFIVAQFALPAAWAGSLQVGFADTDITPKLGSKPVFMAGFGHNRKAVGILDPLKARAIVLSDSKQKVAVVSVDLVGFFYPDVLKVRAQLSGFDYILVSSTHNHEGPDTMGLWGESAFQSGVDLDYLALVRQRIIEAVRQADKARQDVEARIGIIQAPELLRDNREPFVKHDDLVVIEFRQGRPAGKRVGLVVQWNCHPEDLDSKNTRISADLVGTTIKHLQAKDPSPVLYLTGTVGGLMTTLGLDVKSIEGKPLASGTVERVDRYGQLLAESVDRALQRAVPVALTPMEVRTKKLILPVENNLYLLAWQLGVLDREIFAWKDEVTQARPVMRIPEGHKAGVETELGWLRLGEVGIAAIPGEIYPELVLSKVQDPIDPGADFPEAAIEPGIYAQMSGKYKMIIGLANDELGYIIPKRQWDEKLPYCYGRKKSQYGEINSLGPNTAPLLCEGFQGLLKGR